MGRLDSILEQISETRNPPVYDWHPDHIAEIDMAIKRNGEWLHQGTVMHRKRLVKLFASILRKDGDQYFLVTPIEKCPVEVESTPFVITLAEKIDDRWFLTNNLGESIELTNQMIDWVDEETPSIEWRNNLSARLNQNVLYQLQLHALEHDGLVDDQLWLKTKAGRIFLGQA